MTYIDRMRNPRRRVLIVLAVLAVHAFLFFIFIHAGPTRVIDNLIHVTIVPEGKTHAAAPH